MLAGFAVFAAPVEPARFAQVEVIVAAPVDALLKLPPFDLVLYRAHRQLPDAAFACFDPGDTDFPVDTSLVAFQSTRADLREARVGRPQAF